MHSNEYDSSVPMAASDSDAEPKARRIVVVGSSGSGKTTLAAALAVELGIPHVELDAIHWLPDWQGRSRDEFRMLTREAVSAEAWVCDGNYSPVRDIVWGRANTLIFLNYSFTLVLRRVLWRTIRRVFTRQRLYSGNRESFRQAFLSSDSIIWWMISTYRRRRKEYPRLFRHREYSGLRIIELRRPVSIDELVTRISQ
jgi:adenylate kinase family enzyme